MLQHLQLTEIPIGTCQMISKAHKHSRTCLHAIGSLCERLDNKFFILVPPPPHRRIRVRIDNSSDVVVQCPSFVHFGRE
jgi:hypothetical protein